MDIPRLSNLKETKEMIEKLGQIVSVHKYASEYTGLLPFPDGDVETLYILKERENKNASACRNVRHRKHHNHVQEYP